MPRERFMDDLLELWGFDPPVERRKGGKYRGYCVQAGVMVHWEDAKMWAA